MEKEIRRLQAEIENEAARVRAETLQAEAERQMQEHIDSVQID
jgi:Na+/phosphate symporter